MARRCRLVVVSNRLPEAPGRASAGGLVTALQPALAASPGSMWVGWSGRGVAAPARLRVRRSSRDGLQLVGLDLRPADVEAHYDGFCNGALWPLLHSFPGRFSVDRTRWEAYRRVNAAFGRTLASRLRPGDAVWVHDYHLIPLAAELRRRGFGGAIGFFLHVPFCPPDVLELMPWRDELLRGLLAYDLVGFHTPPYVRNYVDAVERRLGVDARATQRVAAYPIGIDAERLRGWSRQPRAALRGRNLRAAVLDRRLIIGVDRLDYTKGIPQRLQAFERLLERHPRWRRAASFIQISAPSRTRVPEYVRQRREVEELVGRINGRFGDPDWVPVRYLFKAYAQPELAGYYREADVCLVSPLRDGMNLVAKEFVACQGDTPGVLVLSRFAGAADELEEALLVNPYDQDEVADALDRALSMPLQERQARQEALWRRVATGTAAAWAGRFVEALVRSSQGAEPEAVPEPAAVG